MTAGVPNGAAPGWWRIKVTELDGSQPDLEKIVSQENWAKGLHFDVTKGSCFALDDTGVLLVINDGNQCRWVPSRRFLVSIEITGEIPGPIEISDFTSVLPS